MKFVNESETVVRIPIGKGGIRVEPKGVVEIEDGYARARRNDNGSRRPSVIEELAPQMKPADLSERAIWMQAPAAQTRDHKTVSFPTVDGLVAGGMSRGQAEIVVRQELQSMLDRIGGGHSDKPSTNSKR
jgi:hypothetical protein